MRYVYINVFTCSLGTNRSGEYDTPEQAAVGRLIQERQLEQTIGCWQYSHTAVESRPIILRSVRVALVCPPGEAPRAELIPEGVLTLNHQYGSVTVNLVEGQGSR